MVDPDAVDHFGHYLAYDTRLALAATRSGLSFSVVGHESCDPAGLDVSFRLQPVLSRHSWIIGKCPMGAAASDMASFRLELAEALKRKDATQGRDFFWFLYVGSLEHAKCISDVLHKFERHRFLVNLFYTPFFDYQSEEYFQSWREFVEGDHPRLRMSAPSRQFSEHFADRFGRRLEVTPHPSTTFGDSDIVPAPVPTTDEPVHFPLRILFPGGMREEKGFRLSTSVALLLEAERPHFCTCTVRALIRPSTSLELLGDLQDLERAGVRLVSGSLEDADFRDFLADSDLIVLPYGKEFRERTSGLLIDAILLSIPVVVTAGTWLADLVLEHGIGRVADDSVQSLRAEVVAAAAEHAVLRANMISFRSKYISENSWARLVEFVQKK